jgi:predicted ribosome quality control (RQC) complex YloA/Tae2 family protein
MGLSSREIEDVTGEFLALQGSLVQKVFLPTERTVLLELRVPSASHLLLLCAEPGRARIHRATVRPPSPESPYPFQGLLRAELVGLRLAGITHRAAERAICLTFTGKERSRVLRAELGGRHGNLFLLDERTVVRGSAVAPRAGRADNRPGSVYTCTAPFERSMSREEDRKSRFRGEGPFALSAAIERAYWELERSERLAERRRALVKACKATRDRLLRTLPKVRADLARCAAAEEHRRRGEAFKANLHRLHRGMKDVTLTVYTETGAQETTLSLDPSRTPGELAEREFHAYRRLTAGRVRAAARLEELERDLAGAEAALARSEAMSDEDLLSAEAKPLARSLPRKRPGRPRRPFREFIGAGDQRIRVGRSARDNDALTLRTARGNDLWLHARGVAGAHVVVPQVRAQGVKEETIRQAALLAAHFSDSRGEGRVEVVMTRVKHVKKPKGAGEGAVVYFQERTLVVAPDAERLTCLLASEVDPE